MCLQAGTRGRTEVRLAIQVGTDSEWPYLCVFAGWQSENGHIYVCLQAGTRGRTAIHKTEVRLAVLEQEEEQLYTRLKSNCPRVSMFAGWPREKELPAQH